MGGAEGWDCPGPGITPVILLETSI